MRVSTMGFFKQTQLSRNIGSAPRILQDERPGTHTTHEGAQAM
jgi:hypothetical protein